MTKRNLIGKKNIDSNVEVWLNLHYPWTQAIYTRTLGKLRALGVKFIDPVVGNSTVLAMERLH